VSITRGIFRFLYDFIIGDDWKIAAGVVTALVVGIILLHSGLPTSAVVAITATLVAAAFTIALVVDVRSHSN
jgi:hypothetical protein